MPARVLPILTVTVVLALLVGACTSEASDPAKADPTADTGTVTTRPPTSAASPGATGADPGGSSHPAGCAATDLDVHAQAALLVFAGLNGNPGEAARALERGYGGIFVTSATAYEVADGTLRELLRARGSSTLVGIDQEGGRVARLSDPVIALPSARQMHRTMTTAQIHQAATTLGGQLAELGVTVDFAPSVDVSDQPDDSVIGDRSFSDDPHEAATAAAAFARGLADAGVLPVFKHFPGHGHGSGDSHHGLVTTPALAELRQNDLVAFSDALAQVPEAAVMLGHLIVPGLTGDQPASVSPEAVTGLLRGEMGFDGLVLTDDLGAMAGIRELYSTPQAAVLAAVAGADLLLVPEVDGEAVVDGLVEAVDRGSLPRAQLETSAQRVLDAQNRPGC